MIRNVKRISMGRYRWILKVYNGDTILWLNVYGIDMTKVEQKHGEWINRVVLFSGPCIIKVKDAYFILG